MRKCRSKDTITVKSTEINHRRHPGQVATRGGSIQLFCRECMGFDSGGAGSMFKAVKECTAPGCWLFPWRNGKMDMSSLHTGIDPEDDYFLGEVQDD